MVLDMVVQAEFNYILEYLTFLNFSVICTHQTLMDFRIRYRCANCHRVNYGCNPCNIHLEIGMLSSLRFRTCIFSFRYVMFHIVYTPACARPGSRQNRIDSEVS